MSLDYKIKRQNAPMAFGYNANIETGSKIQLKDGRGGAYQLRLNPAKAPESMTLAAQRY